MAKIIKMDHKLANMIAAGEVVDRPASIIKELVENAIDANAKSITIECLDMGMNAISVLDDGDGMDQADALLAFERHATSKIKTEQDLSHIQSLGFRGEALAAISAVSKVKLETKQENSQGYKVVIEAGKVIENGFTAVNKGTKITVSDLFYNTPARFKYIKSEMAEKNAIIDTFNELALSNPTIRFQLYLDDKLHKQTFGDGDYENLIAALYGTQAIKDLTITEDIFQKIHVKAFLAAPHMSRSRKKDIHLFVNGRHIKNYSIIQAIIDGYHGYLMLNKYPLAFVYLKMDPSLVDVNVHPQKLEVKFVNESMLKFHVEKIVKAALNHKTHQVIEAKPKSFIIEEPKQSFVKQSLDFAQFDAPATPKDQESFNQTLNEAVEIKTTFEKLPDFEYVGIFAGTYLLFQNEQGLYLMDQHAAAERIRYEYYYEAFANPVFTEKPLLIPYELALVPSDFDTIRKHLEAFHKIGFTFSDNQKLLSVPYWLNDEEFDLAIESMVHMLQEKNAIDLGLLRDQIAKDRSCKTSIRANKALSKSEIEHLVSSLRKCSNPYTCPHGRPTLIKITHYEIEKMFKRVL